MSQVPAAATAVHLGACHEVAPIRRGRDRPFNRFEEAGPARAAFKLRPGLEERQTARHTVERTAALLDEKRTRARTLGAVLAHDVILLGRELLTPFLLGFRHFERFIRAHHRLSVACLAISRTSSAGRMTGSSPSPSVPLIVAKALGRSLATCRTVRMPTIFPLVRNAGVPMPAVSPASTKNVRGLMTMPPMSRSAAEGAQPPTRPRRPNTTT